MTPKPDLKVTTHYLLIIIIILLIIQRQITLKRYMYKIVSKSVNELSGIIVCVKSQQCQLTVGTVQCSVMNRVRSNSWPVW